MISFGNDVLYVFKMVMVGLVGLSWPSAIGTHLAVGTRVCFVPPGVLLSCTGHPFSQKDPATGIIVNCEARSGARDHSCKSQWTYSVMIDPMGWVCHGILSPEIFPVHLGRPNFVAAMNGFVSEAVLVPTKSSRGGQHLFYQPPRPHNPDNSVKLRQLEVVTAGAPAIPVCLHHVPSRCVVAYRSGSAVGSSVIGRATPGSAAIDAAASRTNLGPNDAGGTGAAVPPAVLPQHDNSLKCKHRAAAIKTNSPPPVASSAVGRATRRRSSPASSAIVAAASRTNPVLPVNAGGTGAAVPPAARTKSKNRLKPQRRAIKKVGRDSSGHRVCIHNIRLSLCKSCPGGGASLCEHQKQKCWCRVCGGSARCAHGKQRSRCVECGGAGICEHKKLRHRCVECGGAGICEHKKVRHRCSFCATCK